MLCGSGRVGTAVGDHGGRDSGEYGVADHVLGAGAGPRLADGEVGGGVEDQQGAGRRGDDLDDLHDSSPSSSVRRECIESY